MARLIMPVTAEDVIALVWRLANFRDELQTAEGILHLGRNAEKMSRPDALFISILGQIAVAKYLGLDYESVLRNHTGVPMFKVGEQTIQLRSTPRWEPSKLMFNSLYGMKGSILVLTTAVAEGKFDAVAIAGWLRTVEFNKVQTPQKGEGGDEFGVPEGRLHDIRDLAVLLGRVGMGSMCIDSLVIPPEVFLAKPRIKQTANPALPTI